MMDNIVVTLKSRHNDLNEKLKKGKFDSLLPIQQKAVDFFKENDVKTNLVELILLFSIFYFIGFLRHYERIFRILDK